MFSALSLTGCDNDPGGGGTPNPNPNPTPVAKSLRVTFDQDVYTSANIDNTVFTLGIFTAGKTFADNTTVQSAKSQSIAYCDSSKPFALPVNYTLTLPLYTQTDQLWTGSGTYDIYAVIGDATILSNAQIYRKLNVPITNATTNISVASSDRY